jgi:alpha-galactosidase
LVSRHGSSEIWVKPLAGGGRAVALFNRGSSPVRVGSTARAVGLPRARRYMVRDLWRHATRRTSGAIDSVVPADSVVLYRVTAA